MAVALIAAGVAALVALLPVLTPDLRRYLDQAYLDLWRAVGRDDLAVSPGRDITLSASNVTWYGPLGVMLLAGGIAVAVDRGSPAAGSRGSAALLRPDPRLLDRDALGAPLLPGRCGALPDGSGGARRSHLGDRDPLAAARMGPRRGRGHCGHSRGAERLEAPLGRVAASSDGSRSYWRQPRSQAQGSELHVPDLIRFVDEPRPGRRARRPRASRRATPATSFFGPGLDRRLDLISARVTDAPRATWAFVSPSCGDGSLLRAVRALDAPRDRALGVDGCTTRARRTVLTITAGAKPSGWRESNPRN